MFGLFCYLLAVLASPFESKSRLEAENAALRHQLTVLRRNIGPAFAAIGAGNRVRGEGGRRLTRSSAR